MSKQQEHPAELLHRARDLVQDATTHLEQFTEPSPDDLYGLGSAIVTGLSALWQLSDVLTKQVMDYDDSRSPKGQWPTIRWRICGHPRNISCTCAGSCRWPTPMPSSTGRRFAGCTSTPKPRQH